MPHLVRGAQAGRLFALRLLATFSVVAACASPGARAEDTVDAAPVTKENLAARYSLRVEDIRDGAVPGFFEVTVADRISYVSVDGRYLFRGEVIDLSDNTNLTAKRQAADRAALLATIDPATEIVFTPTNGPVKHRITVFTDVDCGYCRQLHRDIAKTNELGIEVRYVAYPRTGPNTESWTKAERVWCSADRRDSLTKAKLGGEIPPTDGCDATPVGDHYALGHRLGMVGTPGVYTESGVELGGYFAPDELLAKLDQLAQHE